MDFVPHRASDTVCAPDTDRPAFRCVCLQQTLIEEIRDVAGREKLSKYVSGNDIDDLLTIINAFCRFSTIEKEVAPNAIRDPKDLYLLALADTIGADYIVSGDADLTELGMYNQSYIVKLADFKQIMNY